VRRRPAKGKSDFSFYFSRNFSINFNSQFSNLNLSEKMTFSEIGPKMKVV
jgi:hypothetical protein